MIKFILYLTTSSIKAIAYLAAFLISVAFLPLNEINVQDPGLSTLKPLDGPLAGNSALSQAQLLFLGNFTGPETLLPHKGYLYFGVSDGRILRVPVTTNGDVKDIEEIAHVQGDNRCTKYTGLWDQKSCGRPLGMHFDSTGGNLYVLDAYAGIKQINMKTRKVTSVLDITKAAIAGRKVIFLDDFALKETPKGNIFYMTDASAQYEVDSVVWSTFTHESTGRVLSYHQSTDVVNVIAKDLSFANGITLTDDGNHLLVNELNERRVLKISIKDETAPKVDILIDNLPGFPDNIRRSSRPSETYWLALYEAYSIDHSNINHKILSHHTYLIPYLVRLALNLAQLSRTLEGYVGAYIPLTQVTYLLENGVIYKLISARESIGGAIEINSQGQVVRSLYSLDHAISFLSEVREVNVNGNKYLFLGSYFNNFLGKLPLDK